MLEPSTLELLLHWTREGLLLALSLSAPMVLAALVVGFVVSVLQAITQINDSTLILAPKLCGVVAALWIAAPWLGRRLVGFTLAMFEVMPYLAQQ